MNLKLLHVARNPWPARAGLFGVWNTSTDLSAYSVLAETEQDIVVHARMQIIHVFLENNSSTY